MTKTLTLALALLFTACVEGGQQPTNPSPTPDPPSMGSDDHPSHPGGDGSDGGSDDDGGGVQGTDGDSQCDVSVNGNEVFCDTPGDSDTASCACIVDGVQQSTCTAPAEIACNFGVPGESNCCGF